jgi:hypothetical protein
VVRIGCVRQLLVCALTILTLTSSPAQCNCLVLFVICCGRK